MLKALLKKQLLEYFSGFSLKGKEGNNRGKGAKLGAAMLILLTVLMLLGMFFFFCFMMVPVIESGNGSLYISVCGILSALMVLMGSVFLTYNTLYEARDNDLLLSMPVLPRIILFARMAGLYITTFGFQLMVLLPSAIVYFLTVGFSITVFAAFLLSLLILPMLSLTVALLLGFVIALFSSKIRNKSFISVAVSIVFFGLYYFSMLKINDFINILIYHSEQVLLFTKKWLYPFFLFGKGISGDILSYVLFATISLAAFGSVYFILSRTFLRLATVNKGQKKLQYKEKRTKKTSARRAFFRKELVFYKNTPVYILNSSFGSLMLLVISVIFAVKKEALLPIMVQNGFPEDSIALIVGIALCLVASSNNLTAVSVSLEGKCIYLLHSLPCEVKDIFFGKIMLQMMLTGIPLVIGNVIVSLSLGADIVTVFLLVAFSIIFALVLSATGLAVNLLFPKMEWTNESVPVKQSLSSMLGIISGFAYGFVLLISAVILSGTLTMQIFLLCATVLFCLIGFALSRWLYSKGAEKFMRL